MSPAANLKTKEELKIFLSQYELSNELIKTSPLADNAAASRINKIFSQRLRLTNISQIDEILKETLIDEDLVELLDYKSKIVRYLINASGEVVIAREGRPSVRVPAHHQMTQARFHEAKCLAAGNLSFSVESEKICFISNKSGDFRPSPEKILWMLAFLNRNYYGKLADEIVIELQSSTIEQFLVKKEDFEEIISSVKKSELVDFSALTDHAAMDYNLGIIVPISSTINNPDSTRRIERLNRKLFNDQIEGVRMPGENQIHSQGRGTRIENSVIRRSSIFTDEYLRVDGGSSVTDTDIVVEENSDGIDLRDSHFNAVKIQVTRAPRLGLFQSVTTTTTLSTPPAGEASAPASNGSTKRQRDEELDYAERKSDSEVDEEREEKRPRM